MRGAQEVYSAELPKNCSGKHQGIFGIVICDQLEMKYHCSFSLGFYGGHCQLKVDILFKLVCFNNVSPHWYEYFLSINNIGAKYNICRPADV